MKRKIYFFLKNFLGFSRRESRGFVLILPAILLLYGIPVVYEKLLVRHNKKDYQAYKVMVDSLLRAGWQPYAGISPADSVSQDQDTVKSRPVFRKPNNPQLNRLTFTEADSILLQVVPGIGQTMAGRVIKFRDNLGGLHSKDQLLEVYGMTPEVMDRVFESFEFEPGIHRKIKINQAEVAELAKHPYIHFGAAKVIVAFREQHGAYNNADDLLKIKILNEEWLERLRPYLEF